MSALARAVTFTEMDDVSLGVPKNLDLDVPRTLEVLLEIDRAVAERRFGLAPRGRVRSLELLFVARRAHALAATSRRGLDEHRETDLAGFAKRCSLVVCCAPRARHHRNAGFGHQASCLGLVPHATDLLRSRADERQFGLAADLRELGVLGEESVARVDGVRARDLRRRDQSRDVQVRLARRRRPDAHRFVREAHVERVGIDLGVDGDRPQVEHPAGSDDTQGDLAPVGDQNLLEHDLSSFLTSRPRPPGRTARSPARRGTRRSVARSPRACDRACRSRSRGAPAARTGRRSR